MGVAGSWYLEQQDELREPLDGPGHQAVERDAVWTGLLALLRGGKGTHPGERISKAVHAQHTACAPSQGHSWACVQSADTSSTTCFPLPPLPPVPQVHLSAPGL